jgi:hypothetical protein
MSNFERTYEEHLKSIREAVPDYDWNEDSFFAVQRDYEEEQVNHTNERLAVMALNYIQQLKEDVKEDFTDIMLFAMDGACHDPSEENRKKWLSIVKVAMERMINAVDVYNL